MEIERGSGTPFTLKLRYAGHHSGSQSLMRWYVHVNKENDTRLGHQHLMPSARVCTEMFSSGLMIPEYGSSLLAALTLYICGM